MVAAITGFWFPLRTHTPEPPSCGLPLYIHVSTHNGGSKPVGNTEGSDIKKSDLGGNIVVLGNVTTDMWSCGTSNQVVFLILDIGVLGNVTTDIGSCETSDQVVFLIIYFTGGHLTTTITSIDNVGSPGESYTPLCLRPLIVYYRMLHSENMTGKLLIFLCNTGGHMVAAITGFWCRLYTSTPEPPSCGLPLHIHVSTRNGYSKPVENTKGSDIERSDLGGNIGVISGVVRHQIKLFFDYVFHRMLLSENATGKLLIFYVIWAATWLQPLWVFGAAFTLVILSLHREIYHCIYMFSFATGVVSRWGIQKGLIQRGLIFEGILVLLVMLPLISGVVGHHIKLFFIPYFTCGHLTTTTTSFDNVGSPGESYAPLCWRPLIVYYRMLLSENATGKLLIFYVICHMVAAITGFWCRLHTHTPKPPSCGLPFHIHVSTRNGGSKPARNTEGSDIERSDLGRNIGVLGNVTTDIGSCETSDQDASFRKRDGKITDFLCNMVTEAMMNFSCVHCFWRRSLLNLISWRGGHMVATITGFWCRLHTHTPEPSLCGLPLHIHVSPRNGGSKPVGNKEGSDIERSDLGRNIGLLGNVTTDIGSYETSDQVVFLIMYFTGGHLTTITTSIDNVASPNESYMSRNGGSKPMGNTKGFDIERFDLGGNIGVLGGHLTTITTSIDNVGSPGESYTPLCWRPHIVYYRMLLLENVTGKIIDFFYVIWGSNPVGNTKGSDIKRSDLGGNIRVLGNVTTNIGSCGTSDQVDASFRKHDWKITNFLCNMVTEAMMNFSRVHCFRRRSLLNLVSWRGGHMVAAITGFWCCLHTRTPEPLSCDLPLHIHVSTRNGDGKPVGNTKGSHIEQSDLGRNIDALGNVTTDIGSCGTSDQVVFLIPYFTGDHLTTTTTFIDNVGSPGKAYVPLLTEAMMNFSRVHCFRRRSLLNLVSWRGGHMVAAITSFWCRLHTRKPEPSSCVLPLYIHVSTRNEGSKPMGNTEWSDIERSDIGRNIGVLGYVTTDIGNCGTSDQPVGNIEVSDIERSDLGGNIGLLGNVTTDIGSCGTSNQVGGHMVAAIMGFGCRLHTRTPEPPSCGLPLHIHVSTRNGGSKPMGNTEGSDIERSDLGGNIGVLGNVTTYIGSCGTSDQVVFLIMYFTGGLLTTTTTSIDNVGSPGESYTPLCWRPLIVYYRIHLSENATGKLLIFLCNMVTEAMMNLSCVYCFRRRSLLNLVSWRGGHMVAAITGFWCRLHTRTLEPPLCGLPLHIHVSTRNGGSKPMGNTEGSDIERSNLGGNIGLLGNVTSNIRCYETSYQVVFFIMYFTGGYLTTTATYIDNVGSPEESYMSLCVVYRIPYLGGTATWFQPLWVFGAAFTVALPSLRQGSDMERSDLGGNIGVHGNVTTDIGSWGTSDHVFFIMYFTDGHLTTTTTSIDNMGSLGESYTPLCWRPLIVYYRMLLSEIAIGDLLIFYGGHMVATITGFWSRLHTRTPEPPSCGLPLLIHVSTRNRGSKPVGNTEGSDIERSDLGGNIGLLGNVTTDIGSCETSDQVVFLILYFTGGHLTTTTTSIDNVGCPEESYTPRSFDHNTTSVDNVVSPGASSLAGHASNGGVIVYDGSGTRSSTSTVQPGIPGLRSLSWIIDIKPEDATKSRDAFNRKPPPDELMDVSDIRKSVTTSLPENVWRLWWFSRGGGDGGLSGADNGSAGTTTCGDSLTERRVVVL
ncbi:hypothetical protein Tco_1449180 [Tanacetum coccineum]